MKIEIGEVCDLIIEGKTYRQMAEYYKISQKTLHNFLSNEKHSVRAREAFILSADSYADKAEQVLIDAPKDSLELMRARELSQYYKWKAAKRYPKGYGDKIDVTSKDEKINEKIDLSHLSFEQLLELQRGRKSN